MDGGTEGISVLADNTVFYFVLAIYVIWLVLLTLENAYRERKDD